MNQPSKPTSQTNGEDQEAPKPWEPAPGWLERQGERAARDIATWPEWMREERKFTND